MANDNDNEELQLSPEQAEVLEQLFEESGLDDGEDEPTDSDDDWELD